MFRLLTLVILLTGFFSPIVQASIILPPDDLKDLIHSTDHIVLGEVTNHIDEWGFLNQFLVHSTLKGGIAPESEIILREYGDEVNGLFTVLNGDLNFEIGSKYLLFLIEDHQGNYRLNYFSLGAYKEGIRDGQHILAHTSELVNLCSLTPISSELLQYFRKDILLDIIQSEVCGIERKFGLLDNSSIPDRPLSANNNFKTLCPNVPPSHCTTLFGGPASLNSNCIYNGSGQDPNNSPGKFFDSNFIVKVANGAANDPNIPNEYDLLADAITELNSFEGISVIAGSPILQVCPISNCFGLSDFNDVVESCSTNDNEITIFFNDPCFAVPSFAVAIGGSFFSSTCHQDPCGNQWLTNSKPFVAVSSVATSSGDYGYTRILIHEMLHSVGLNHISGLCTAIMNAASCATNASNNVANYGITNLDRDCVEWMYNIGNAISTCSDGVQNNGEIGIDCGGTCPDCQNLTEVKLRVKLEGPLSGNLMSTDLSAAGLLPLVQPYHVSPYAYNGTESFASYSDFPSGVVDWIYVEARSPSNVNAVIDKRSGLLRNDGMILDLDGSIGLSFDNLIPGQAYHFAVYHRSHLGVISSSQISVPNSNIYDFTTSYSSALGSDQLKEVNGAFVLHAGDFDGSGVINVLDFLEWFNDNTSVNEYVRHDGDLNHLVNILDFLLWFDNRSVVGIPEL